jgi:hypothetical protein
LKNKRVFLQSHFLFLKIKYGRVLFIGVA